MEMKSLIQMRPGYSGDSNGDSKLDTNETWVFTATYYVTEEEYSPLVNTATVSGADALSRSVQSEDTASVNILRPAIDIDKTAEPAQAYEGDTITYTYTVTNPGDTPLYDISVTDDKVEDVIYQSGDTNGNSRLDTGETWTFTADYTVSAEDTSPLVNTATATGADALARTVTAQASASVSITIIETASISVQIDTGPEASIFIWDENTSNWAIDENTGQSVDGTNHSTPDIIAVAGGHSYYVWVYAGEEWYEVSALPDGWEAIGYIEFLELEVAAVYGYAAADNLYSVNFTVYLY